MLWLSRRRSRAAAASLCLPSVAGCAITAPLWRDLKALCRATCLNFGVPRHQAGSVCAGDVRVEPSSASRDGTERREQGRQTPPLSGSSHRAFWGRNLKLPRYFCGVQSLGRSSVHVGHFYGASGAQGKRDRAQKHRGGTGEHPQGVKQQAETNSKIPSCRVPLPWQGCRRAPGCTCRRGAQKKTKKKFSPSPFPSFSPKKSC